MMPIVLIEDNAQDAELALLALRASGLENELLHFADCESAQVWLNSYTDTCPLLLLDLLFPGKMDGLNFLTWLRAHPTFRAIPVIVMAADYFSRPRAYGLGVIGYLVKPVSSVILLNAIQSIGLRWRITA
jgi:CheY-like chemotaxis protein